MIEMRTNWAGNLRYSATRFHYPQTIEQVQELVSRSSQLKVLGSGHSFNAIADTAGDMLSLEHYRPAPVIDRERHTLTTGAGVKYGEISRLLHEAGYGLPNLASLPHISVAGACATATHGSGERNGNLATAVSAIEMVRADGEVVRLARPDHQDLGGAVVNLGGLGVVTRLTLDLVPSYDIRQVVYENLPLARLEAHFDEIQARAYSVSLFTGWQSTDINQVWLKYRATPGDEAAYERPPRLFGATLARTQLHPIEGMSPAACNPQMGQPGPWYQRLPHFRMEFTPSSGEELQSEYLVPRRQARAALQVLEGLRSRLAPLLQICEIRTIAADDLWLSPCYRQERVGIHFTWKKDWPEVSRLLPLIEEKLGPLEAIPHWGKLFTMSATGLQSLFPRMGDFQDLLRCYDPQRKFGNAFLEQYIYD